MSFATMFEEMSTTERRSKYIVVIEFVWLTLLNVYHSLYSMPTSDSNARVRKGIT